MDADDATSAKPHTIPSSTGEHARGGLTMAYNVPFDPAYNQMRI
jgi:hypothetical protein